MSVVSPEPVERLGITVTIRLQKVAVVLVISVLVVTVASLIMSIINYCVQHFGASASLKELSQDVFMEFFLGSEFNVPTWYASVTLFICAELLLIITALVQANQNGMHTARWGFLAVFFALMSLDEIASIHENGAAFLSKLIVLPYYPWLAFGFITIVLMAVFYWSFIRDLPAMSRNLFILAGAVFVFGAWGIELLESFYDQFYGQATLIYELLIYIEEFLEMAGVAIFIFALLTHLRFLLAGRSVVLKLDV